MLTITHPIQLVPREGHEANAEVGTGHVETKEESSEKDQPDTGDKETAGETERPLCERTKNSSEAEGLHVLHYSFLVSLTNLKMCARAVSPLTCYI